MMSGTPYEQGEIVLIPFPFTSLKTTKKRPVLIISSTDYNKKTDDFIVCGITSNLKDAKFSVIIDKKDLAKGFMPVKSRIKADKVFTLEQSLVIKRISKVKKDILIRVSKELMKIISTNRQ